MQNHFNYRGLEQTAHRPWAVPGSPWIMRQTWHELLFAHWPVDASALGPSIPPPRQLDLFDGRAWLGIVPFRMTNVAPRAVPALPRLSAFPELNVRTYVTLGGKRGGWFFSLDAASALAVFGARTFFHLPYYTAEMRVERRNGAIVYRSRRTTAGAAAAELVAAYRPTSAIFNPVPGTLEHFLTERYCLYTVDRTGRPLRLEIHHGPWPLQRADADIELNTMASACGIGLPDTPPLLHFSLRQDMVGWPLVRVR